MVSYLMAVVAYETKSTTAHTFGTKIIYRTLGTAQAPIHHVDLDSPASKPNMSHLNCYPH